MIKVTDENGVEVDAYTADELAVIRVEADTAKAEAQTAREEAEKYKKVSAEKTENFKKLHEMNEAEKAKLSTEQIENMKRIEAAESKATALESMINEDKNTRIKTDREKALERYHGGNAELKKSLEANFDLINLEGTDTETIYKRAQLAASMEKGKMSSGNPLMANLNGSAPSIPQEDKHKEFLKSEEGKKALKLMGLPEEK